MRWRRLKPGCLKTQTALRVDMNQLCAVGFVMAVYDGYRLEVIGVLIVARRGGIMIAELWYVWLLAALVGSTYTVYISWRRYPSSSEVVAAFICGVLALFMVWLGVLAWLIPSL